VNLLLEEDLSPRIAQALRKLGVDAVSVQEVGRQGLSDREQLEYAACERRCFVTRNRDDYRILTRERFDRDQPHPGVLVISSRLPPDDFGRIAAAVKRYLDRHGANPSSFLFDFVSDPDVGA
jgi:endonuclease/exonuclease/phosphatase family metal-dependent hydrolase